MMRCHILGFSHLVAIVGLLSSAEAAPTRVAIALGSYSTTSTISPRSLPKPSSSCIRGSEIFLDGHTVCSLGSKDDLVHSHRQKSHVNLPRDLSDGVQPKSGNFTAVRGLDDAVQPKPENSTAVRDLNDAVQSKSGNPTAVTQWRNHKPAGNLNLSAGEVDPVPDESKEEHKMKIEQVNQGEKEVVNHEKKRAERLRKDIEDLKEKEKKRQADVLEREQKEAEQAYYDIAVKESVLRSFNALIQKIDRLRNKTMKEREQGLSDIVKGNLQKRAV
ncbi:hypothetical protein IWX90DRAFT_17796 [Phyllosticta citrichinensis]|uniref:Uncharacterized protein n=1 Tax=Phyllosticta citrichinensis TaxID=1130410 RepID=A0ABR1Y7H9_9PEZI